MRVSARRSFSRQRPTPSKFSSAKPSGSSTPWQARQALVGAVRAICSRIVSTLLPTGGFLQRLDIRRRRRGRRAGDVVEDPRAAQHRRRAVRIGRDHQHAGLAEQAVAHRIGQLHAAEVRTLHVAHAVVHGQPLVEVGVVAVHQIEHAAVARGTRCRRTGGSPRGSPRAGRRRGRDWLAAYGKMLGSGSMSASLPMPSHWKAKSRASDCERGSASIRRTCCASTGVVTELAARRHLEQLVVRQVAPQEERQTRRELQVVEPVRHRRGSRAGGAGSARYRKSGLARMRVIAPRMPSSKVLARARRGVGLHQVVRSSSVRSGRRKARRASVPTICCGAGALFVGRLRVAGEDAPAARRCR